jgi:hypothetical protein
MEGLILPDCQLELAGKLSCSYNHRLFSRKSHALIYCGAGFLLVKPKNQSVATQVSPVWAASSRQRYYGFKPELK